MSELPAHKLEQKKDWTLTPSAFKRLLDWLDSGVGSEGEKYLDTRRRLVSYFDRKNCQAPDELADETLNRVARRLEEEDLSEAETPARYCYIVARFVFMEYLRAAKKSAVLMDEISRQPRTEKPNANDKKEYQEKLLDCLEQCTGKLEHLNREIIARYYASNERTRIENRRVLAEELGITVNALSIRACRIRDRLEACVRECAGKR